MRPFSSSASVPSKSIKVVAAAAALWQSRIFSMVHSHVGRYLKFDDGIRGWKGLEPDRGQVRTTPDNVGNVAPLVAPHCSNFKRFLSIYWENCLYRSRPECSNSMPLIAILQMASSWNDSIRSWTNLWLILERSLKESYGPSKRCLWIAIIEVNLGSDMDLPRPGAMLQSGTLSIFFNHPPNLHHYIL